MTGAELSPDLGRIRASLGPRRRPVRERAHLDDAASHYAALRRRAVEASPGATCGMITRGGAAHGER